MPAERVEVGKVKLCCNASQTKWPKLVCFRRALRVFTSVRLARTSNQRGLKPEAGQEIIDLCLVLNHVGPAFGIDLRTIEQCVGRA